MKSDALREYVRRLSDDDFRFLCSRFSQMLCGDRAEILEFVSRNKEIDRWLSSASGSKELFDLVDQLGDAVMARYNKEEKSGS